MGQAITAAKLNSQMPSVLTARAGSKTRPIADLRIYLAARYARKGELQSYSKDLEAAGAELSCRWLANDNPALNGSHLEPALRGGELAAMDLEDLRLADVCIAFTEEPDSPQGRGGRHTELGIAIGLGLRIVLIGPREHVFHCLPEIEHYQSWPEAASALGLLSEASPLNRNRHEVSAHA